MGQADACIRLKALVPVEVEPYRLLALVIDLARYVEVEPRLVAAEWLDGPVAPAVGARARLVADVPFALRILAPIVGEPTGVVTVREWVAGESIRCGLDAPAFTGWLAVSDTPGRGDSSIGVTGEIWFRSRMSRAAIRPFRSVIEARARRSIERAIGRASDALVARDPE